MSTLFNDTMDAAKDAAKNTVDAAKNTMESAKDGTQHAVSSARSTLMDGLHAVSSVLSILRGFGVSDALGLVGLTRRRGPFESIAIFGAGVAVGAGVGLLFAPVSGADARRAILGRLKGLEKDAERVVHKAEDQAADLAGKAKDAVTSVEKKIETKVDAAKDKIETKVDAAKDKIETKVDAAKDTVKNKVEAAADAVKDTADQAKSAILNDHYRQDVGTGNNRSAARH